MRHAAWTASLCLAFTLSGCDVTANRDLVVPHAAKDAAGGFTVNGRISVGAEAEVSGDLRTVNGSVQIGPGARLHDLDTVNGIVEVADEVAVGRVAAVNGDVALGMRVKAGKSVSTVNGRLRIAGGSVVDGDVSTVNGPLELRGVTVRGGVANHGGDVRLLDGALIEGDVVLGEPDGSRGAEDIVVIGVGVQVRGVLRAERPIVLYVHHSARLGRVEGVTPRPLEGTDVPPF